MTQARGRSLRRVALVGLGLTALCCGVTLCAGAPCPGPWLRYGVWADECPDSDLRLTTQIQAYNLVRGQDQGWVHLVPQAHWLVGEGRWAWQDQRPLRRGYSWELALKDAAGAEVPGLEVVEQVRDAHGGVRLRVKLPVVPDGDYQLAASVDTPFQDETVQVPLPLYAPALVHTMTDRPLYKPGQTVLFRSATLRRTDEHPLEGRPGRWVVRSPSGDEMLVEKDQAGPWGIADGSFPLDEDAEQGTWRVRWETGAASDEVAFDVRPFRLPRFTVEASGARAWFAIGQPLVVEGRAAYSSGAPVGSAPVTVSLRVAEGRWPLPLEWEEPREVTTLPDGRFRVDYGLVPPDLMDRAMLGASVGVVDETGERADGGASLVLSHESLRLEAVTELGDGVVEKYNNRVYVRATTPDGQPLAGASLLLRRPYDPADPGKEATTDVDGVAALQLDPGAPVTVVHPAAPVRQRPFQPEPSQLVVGEELSDQRPLDLPERRALDAFLPAVERCAVFSTGQVAELALRVDPSGATRVVVPSDRGPLGECLAGAARSLRFPAGDDRSFQLAWRISDPQLPSLSVSTPPGADAQLGAALQEAAVRARACLPRGVGQDGARFASVHWSLSAGSARPEVVVEGGPDHRLPPAVEACATAKLRDLRLERPTAASALGVSQVDLRVPLPPGAASSQPTVTTGYELAVTARDGEEELGSGRLVMPVGQVPELRIRATPPLAHPGEEVTFEFVTGPSWFGQLPETVWLMQGTARLAEGKIEEKAVTFRLPDQAEGFLHLEVGSARAVVFSAPAQPLSVSLTTDRAAYEPGAVARLTVATAHGDRPVPAGVSLVGVDQLLGQLAPLLGPDDLGRVTVRASSDRPPFGSFDARALALGQIRGENAARAAVMRVSQLPMDPAGDEGASASLQAALDTESPLIRNFYRVLLVVADRVRDWERSAAEGEQLDNARVVALWEEAVDSLDGDDPAVDAFGRSLSLAVVPEPLLAKAAPRSLISDATRLPEDLEDFVQYVVREVEP